MGRKKTVEPSPDTPNQEVKPERKKGTSSKPKEAKKPVVKASVPKNSGTKKAKAAPATAIEPPKALAAEKPAKAESGKKAAKTATVKGKAKDLKKQWKSAADKVDELKKAFKKLKKKEGKAKAKESLGVKLKTAKLERKTLKKAFKATKKSKK